MDFGLLPPEINSGRMYAGPGPAPMLAAAAAWDGLAGELGSTASSYQSTVEGLTGGSWQGPSSMSMDAAAAPYVAWMSASAVQAEQTANQARAAAAAYETAFAATVPPPVIAANRSLLMTLIATNILGQNTAAIAATEFHYAEMWAQDAAAMYGYASSSATAAELMPFTPPPQTTNAGGLPTQAATVAQATGTSAGLNAQSTLPQLVTTLPQALQALTSPASSVAPAATQAAAAAPASSLSSIIDFITGPLSPISFIPVGGVPYLLGFQNVLLPMGAQNLAAAASKSTALPGAGGLLAGELSPGAHALGASGSLSAGMGNAGLVGKLSVPPNWATAAPAIRPAALALPASSLEAAPAVMQGTPGNLFGQMAASSLAGRAVTGTGGGAARPVSTGGVAAAGEATTAMIFVIPEDE
ncbi:MAG: PPE family protein [Mycobacterium sp.]